VRLIGRWRQRRRDQQLLASLDERALRDLGVDRTAINIESSVPFWRER
jgi:uncharacterized protein YjiS (DUF1127 family)